MIKIVVIILVILLGFLSWGEKRGLVGEPAEQEEAGVEELGAEIVELPFQEIRLKLSPTLIPTAVSSGGESGDGGEWGVAEQISEHTWTMRVGEDERMASPGEILMALNDYRVRAGSQPLIWDERLAGFAQERADFFESIKNVDEHKGFNDFLEQENGFSQLGFSWVGENSSFGYRLLGVHLIEWVFAGDEPHNRNQLDNKWGWVGIGVRGTAVDIIFGTGKS